MRQRIFCHVRSTGEPYIYVKRKQAAVFKILLFAPGDMNSGLGPRWQEFHKWNF